MTNPFSHSRKIFLRIIPLVILIAWFAGCASNKAGDVKATGDKRITAINTQVTADAVIVAIGYPPITETMNLDSNTWVYWSGRFNRFKVHFRNGVVSTVED